MIAVATSLKKAGVRFAVVGGMAVSYRTIERFTKDVDIAIAVENDSEAEMVVQTIKGVGYFADTVVEQDEAVRLSTVRMVPSSLLKTFVSIVFHSLRSGRHICSHTCERVEMSPNKTSVRSMRHIFMPRVSHARIIVGCNPTFRFVARGATIMPSASPIDI